MADESKHEAGEPASRPDVEPTADPSPEPATEATANDTAAEEDSKHSKDAAEPPKPNPINDRLARFKALQARAKASSDDNTKQAAAETQRLASDPSQIAGIRRKQAIATHKVMKAEVEDSGGDFERKRAWDWTAEESERWDKRMKKKAAHRDNVAFQDYRQESHKVYKRLLKQNKVGDIETYTREKLAAVEKAAAEGSLEIVETEDGELIAVDKNGTFYSTAESTTAFADNKPSKEAIDRLVNDQKRADEAALKKRKDRLAKNGDDADVTYINEKNKHFNQKLARFYNKYTAEIRESFERGTMV